MGAMIKADETRQGMKRKASRQSEVLKGFLVHLVSAFICGLVCCYSYWFPWLYCFINHFMWIYLPSVWPVVFGPKCMFVVANVIVVIVVGEWRQTCAKSRNIHDDMYEEYLRRSRGPRRVLVYKKIEKKHDATVKKISSKAIEIKKVHVFKEIVDEKKEEIAEETHENKDVVETNEKMAKEKQDELKEQTVVDASNLVEDTSELHEQIKESAYEHYANIKKAKEARSTDDDLNSRVEAFIARVNKRRWAEAEANNWLICSA